MEKKVVKELLEIPLLLTKQTSTQNQETAIRAELEHWMKRYVEEDRKLGIKRSIIPYTAALIPDTAQSADFIKLALAIREIAQPEVVPENFNQQCWLKTLHYYWQAKGLILAYKIYGVIDDPIRVGGMLDRRLPATSIENLKLDTDIQLASYHLIVEGEPHIKNWAMAEEIDYPFNSPLELLLQILKEEFQLLWLLGPLNCQPQWLDKRTQRDYANARIRLLKDDAWPSPPPKKNRFSSSKSTRSPYQDTEPEYLRFLRGIGWRGYWLLALRDQNHRGLLDRSWKAYLKNLSAGKELYIQDFDWRNGQPYKNVKTSKSQRVEAIIDELGFIHWVWA